MGGIRFIRSYNSGLFCLFWMLAPPQIFRDRLSISSLNWVPCLWIRDIDPTTIYQIKLILHLVYKLHCFDQICIRFDKGHHSCQLDLSSLKYSSLIYYYYQMIDVTHTLDLFYCMKPQLKPLLELKHSYQRVLEAKLPVTAKNLNVGLLSNPFIKDQQHYRAICHQLNLYNKRVLDRVITDQYEVISNQKLFSIVSDLANLQTREDMIVRLQETWKWWLQQRRRVKQRKDLGVVKYKTDRMSDLIREVMQDMNKSQVLPEPENLPNEKRYAEVFPFEMNYRTAHKEMNIPIRRLSEYKRKLINISDTHFLDNEESKKKRERVLYPTPKRYIPSQPSPQENPQITVENVNSQPINNENSQNANPVAVNGQVPPQVEGDPNKPEETNNQQDLGGFGEEPGEPDEDGGEEEVAVQDKLAPKNKIYTWSNRQREQYKNQKVYQKPYVFYRGQDSLAERRMEQRSFLKQQYSLQVKRQETQMIAKAHEWAAEKQKIAKQRQFVLQSNMNRPRFSFSYEEPSIKEMLGLADQKKYGFYVSAKVSPRPEVILDDKLPVIGQFKPYEKQIKRDRLKSLKHKFAGILNLRQNSQNNSHANSLCQVSPRRRDFSMILNEHSPQRQRDLQLQEIHKIKQSLGKKHININIQTLAQALVPNSGDYKQQKFESPSKQLPNNPFFVEPKKKKKKK